MNMKKELQKKKKVGVYTLSLMRYDINNWSFRLFVDVRKSNKIISKSEEFSEVGLAEDKFKELVEEYKLESIKEGKYKFTPNDYITKPKTSDGYIMQRINKYNNKVVDENCKITTFEGLIRAFIHNKINKNVIVGNYRVECSKLVYKDSDSDNIDILALRLKNGSLLGNASKLIYCGWTRKGDEAPAQRVMFDLNVPLLPFNVFEEAKLNIQNCKIIEQGKEEDFILPKLEWDSYDNILKPVEVYLYGEQVKEPISDEKKKILFKEEKEIYKTYPKGEGKYIDGWSYRYLDKTKLTNRHFVGSMLIKVRSKCFLFDIDRNELKHYRFNPFLVELPKPCETIKEAYEMLKPKEVLQAEKKGLKVLRQGEWFFIPTKRKITEKSKSLPKVIKDGLNKIPKVRSYGILNRWGGDGSLISKTDLKDMLSGVLPKYRKVITKQVKDYNLSAKKYQSFLKREEEFNSTFNFFDYGGELKAGVNRPNRVGKLFIEDGVHYVTGKVEHTGREHEPIELKSWYKAIPNTAIKSFTITGNID